MVSELKNKVQNLKWRMILVDVALILLGCIMIAFPGDSQNIICRAVGIILCVVGAVHAVSYFLEDKTDAVGSLSLAEGAALIGFGVFFLIKPEYLAAFLTVALAIVLLIGGVIKMQYAVDFLRMQVSWWWIELLGAALMILLGIVTFVDPFGAANGLMVFIGISFLIDSVWDLVSIICLAGALKEVKQELQKAEQNEKTVEVNATEVGGTPKSEQ